MAVEGGWFYNDVLSIEVLSFGSDYCLRRRGDNWGESDLGPRDCGKTGNI
jgi:hypothetical protein